MKKKKNDKIKPRIPRGFRDQFSNILKVRDEMLQKIKSVYERYGFMPLETPSIEHVDVLGKHLPETDQAVEGIYAFRTDEQDFVALRYDLTAPLARVVTQYNDLPYPFRRYQIGTVWRQEKKVGIGRFREFIQFDFDTVGTKHIAADAEIALVWIDAFKALGFKENDFIIRVNNRKILNGILEKIFELLSENELIENIKKWYKANYPKLFNENLDFLTLKKDYESAILRAIDKLDRLGLDAVIEILKDGRKDISGDFMPGCYLNDNQVKIIENFLKIPKTKRDEFINQVKNIINDNKIGNEGLDELKEIDNILNAVNINENFVIFDATVVRGLDYYTGPVFEIELTLEIKDKKGKIHKFGSVGGGGRYDNLTMRFSNQQMPATGGSIGVDRLLQAYMLLNEKENDYEKLVIITRMDRDKTAEYQKITQFLRNNGIKAEMYVGTQKNLSKQLKYASSRKALIALIAGSNEFENNQITLKDLKLGDELSKDIKDRAEWVKNQPAQITINRDELLNKINEIFNKYNK